MIRTGNKLFTPTCSDKLRIPSSYLCLCQQQPASPDANSDESSSVDVDTRYEPSDASSAPHIITAGELNELVWDLHLTKNQSELLASRLPGWNVLNTDAKVTYFTANLIDLFPMTGELCYCNDIWALFIKFGIDHDAREWRFFIDTSKSTIKAVLLHNGNVHLSIPVVYSVAMRETYQNMKEILECIHYAENKWAICADFKVIAIWRDYSRGIQILLFHLPLG